MNWKNNNPREYLPRINNESTDATVAFTCACAQLQKRGTAALQIKQETVNRLKTIDTHVNILTGKQFFKSK